MCNHLAMLQQKAFLEKNKQTNKHLSEEASDHDAHHIQLWSVRRGRGRLLHNILLVFIVLVLLLLLLIHDDQWQRLRTGEPERQREKTKT